MQSGPAAIARPSKVSSSAPARLAVDIGGTFTDLVLEVPGRARITCKVLTTHKDPAQGVLDGLARVLDESDIDAAAIGLVIHGTTLATNALIERRGATTALLTTQGHRDALEMAHEDRFEQYDINIDRPPPLVPRHLRLPIRERLDRDGRVLAALDESMVYEVLPLLDQWQVESVAIGYLHAYANPRHEQQTAEILERERPDLSLTLASEVCPEIREFERLSTACANAYVRPLMASYLARLSDQLRQRGLRCPLLLMTSGGGLTTLETATRFPIRLVESGPAGGAILARHVARGAGLDRMLSLDVGGTTAKLCLVDDYEPMTSRSFEVDRVYRFKKGSGLPLRIPVIEMVEIGAGGGSLASVDRLQRIQVGPRSAGSEPGPAAFGRGGRHATVTDADVALGRIVARTFAGGSLKLDAAASGQAIAADVGDPLALDVSAAALGISEVVDENMTAAARAHAAESGLDLESRDMVAFGGAAPLHAVRLGEKLGVRRIIVPVAAGVGSAVGFLLAPIAFEVVRSQRQLLGDLAIDRINEMMAQMRDEALAVVRQAAPEGALRESRRAYMRYVGQGHEICIELPAADYSGDHAERFRQLFESAYAGLYGRVIDGVDIEVLSWTLGLSSDTESPPEQAPDRTESRRPSPSGHQPLVDPASADCAQAAVFERQALRPGDLVEGPALITEAQTTTVVSGAWRAEIDPRGAIVLTRKAEDHV